MLERRRVAGHHKPAAVVTLDGDCVWSREAQNVLSSVCAKGEGQPDTWTISKPPTTVRFSDCVMSQPELKVKVMLARGLTCPKDVDNLLAKQYWIRDECVILMALFEPSVEVCPAHLPRTIHKFFLRIFQRLDEDGTVVIYSRSGYNRSHCRGDINLGLHLFFNNSSVRLVP